MSTSFATFIATVSIKETLPLVRFAANSHLPLGARSSAMGWRSRGWSTAAVKSTRVAPITRMTTTTRTMGLTGSLFGFLDRFLVRGGRLQDLNCFRENRIPAQIDGIAGGNDVV